MYCTKCGSKNTDVAIFCFQCGHQIIKNDLVKLSEEGRKANNGRDSIGSNARELVDVTCPKCGTEWELNPDEAGKNEFICSECSASIPLPQPPLTTPPPPPPVSPPAPPAFIPQIPPPATVPLPAKKTGDATGGVIPYKNPHALIAYYLGIFSLLPAIGFFLAIATVFLGISGIKKYKQNPIIKGTVHAWIGIVLAGISIGYHLLILVAIMISR